MRKILMCGVALLTAGCTTVSQMSATGGSKSDGIVEMSFEYGLFDKIKLDPDSSRTQAAERCRAWGYQNAEPFGGVTRQCQVSGSYGCERWFATIKYQCS